MSSSQALMLLFLVVYAVYRQSRTTEVIAASRFKMALIYAVVAIMSIAQSGWDLPHGAGWGFCLAGMGISAWVGTLRGWKTRLWLEGDGRVLRRGTTLTIALFIAMLVVKIGMGFYARTHGINDGAGFAEILLVVAIMVAIQAEIVFRRAIGLQKSRELHL